MKTAAYIPLHRAVPLFLCPRWLLLRRIRPLFRNRSRVRRKRMPCVPWSPAGRRARRRAPC